MLRDDAIRLRHMLEAAQDAQSFVRGKTPVDLRVSRQLTWSLVKAIEIIGEAASRVSSEQQAALPQIPWPQIIGMRNRLIHAYFDIDVAVVWDVVTHDLGGLIAQLEQALREPT